MADFSDSSCCQPVAGLKTPPASCVCGITEAEQMVSTTSFAHLALLIVLAVNSTNINAGVCQRRCAHVHIHTTQTQITGQKALQISRLWQH